MTKTIKLVFLELFDANSVLQVQKSRKSSSDVIANDIDEFDGFVHRFDSRLGADAFVVSWGLFVVHLAFVSWEAVEVKVPVVAELEIFVVVVEEICFLFGLIFMILWIM